MKRFPESSFDALAHFGGSYEGNALPEELTSSSALITGGPVSITHLIIDTELSIQPVQLFRLPDLPPSFLDRTIEPLIQRSWRAVCEGLTCRKVRWSRRNGYVFNARTGIQLQPATAVEEGKLLELATFDILRDERDVTSLVFDEEISNQHVPSRTWEFVDDEQPTVRQWLEGMGETKLVEPSEKPEVPKDAKKVLAGDLKTTGRVRVAKGAPLYSDDSGSASSDDEKSPTPEKSKSFNGLLRTTNQTADTESEESSSNAGSSVASSHTEKAALHNLLPPGGIGTSQPQKQAQSASDQNALVEFSDRNSARGPSIVDSEDDGKQNPNVGFSMPGSSTRDTAEEMFETTHFPSFGKEFAAVDRVGLTANAASTARWESGNHHMRKPKHKSKLVVPRSSLGTQANRSDQSFSALSSSTSNEFGKSRGTSVSAVSSPNVPLSIVPSRNRNPEPSSDQPWLNLVGERWNSHNELSDKYFPPLPAPTTQTSNPKALSTLTNRLRAAAGSEQHTSLTSTDPVFSQTLIDVSVPDQTRSSQAENSQPSSFMSLIADLELSSDDQVIERVRAVPEDFARKWDTMRQKAPKKSKESNSLSKATKNPSSLKGSLPLPEPVPPPKPKKAPEVPSKSRTSSSKVDLRSSYPAPLPKPKTVLEAQVQLPAVYEAEAISHSESSSEDEDDNSVPSESSILMIDHTFGQLLHRERNILENGKFNDNEDSEYAGRPSILKAQIGVVLVQLPSDSDLRHGPFLPRELQSKLNVPSAILQNFFFQRLTTSSSDAFHLVSLGGIPIEAMATESIYEIIVRDVGGTLFTISIPNSNKIGYKIALKDKIKAEAYAHYAIHVWDARFLLVERDPNQSESSHQLLNEDARNCLDEFISSIDTDGAPPSFQAKLATEHFTTLKARTKRNFSHIIDDITFCVSEVQDLFLEPIIDHPQFNLHAEALPRDEMIGHHRLWWEVSLETRVLSRAVELESRVDEMIRSMDGIGYHNLGPWERNTGHMDEKKVVVEEPFW